MTTAIQRKTARAILNESDLNELADLLAHLKFGTSQARIKVVAAGLTAAASFDITTAAFKALSTITGIDLATGENLPAIGIPVNLQLVASGTAGSLGSYILGDVAATPAIPAGGANVTPGVARLSDDGKTITFPNTVTAFTFTYYPRTAFPLDTTSFNTNAP